MSFVWGVGSTAFAKQPARGAADLVWEAVTAAMSDAQIEPGDIEAVLLGTVFGEPGVAQRSLHGLGIARVPIIRVENACASGTTAFHEKTEAIGLCPEGHGADLVSSGHTSLGGGQPVNPSGGLLSRGHPLGATGLAQVMEIVTQLRGEAGARQVTNARLGLVETMGGGVSGIDGNACVVALLGAT